MKSFIFSLLFFFPYCEINSQTQKSLECLNREFNVVIHILRDTFRKPVITSADANLVISDMNQIWKNICVRFNVCDIRFIDNFNFVKWHKEMLELEYTSIYYEPRTINIIVVEKLLSPSGSSGYATLGGISMRGRPIIVVEKDDALTWIHEMGHYFGLKHTFEPPIGLADGSNCSTTGDGLSDTPPDPNGNIDGSSCTYIDQVKDVNGDYYNPLLENFMSYYGNCRRSFTHQQFEKMVLTYKIDTEASF